MNLKMDDLLANVGKNESSYQMLDDFSVLTGDPEPFSGANRKTAGRKRSTDIRDDDDNDFRVVNDADRDDDINGGDDEQDDDDDDDTKKKVLCFGLRPSGAVNKLLKTRFRLDLATKRGF